MDTNITIKNKEDALLHRQSRMEQIKEYVLANLASDLSIGLVSQKFEMSASTLKHIYKKYTGNSYHHYVTEMRMKKAFELVLLKKYTVWFFKMLINEFVYFEDVIVEMIKDNP